MSKLTLMDALEHIIDGETIAVFAKLEVGTKECFNTEIMRGQRKGGWREEYVEWLDALDLEVDHIGFCNEDTCGNKNMLCLHCKPIRVARRDEV